MERMAAQERGWFINLQYPVQDEPAVEPATMPPIKLVILHLRDKEQITNKQQLQVKQRRNVRYCISKSLSTLS